MRSQVQAAQLCGRTNSATATATTNRNLNPERSGVVSKAKLAIALSTLSVVVLVAWAIPTVGIAHQRVQRTERTWFAAPMPLAPIRLRDEHGGLTASGWINGAGPFVFAIDTGAGVSLISRNVVAQARLGVTKSRRPLVGGLSTSPISSDHEVRIVGLSLGRRENSRSRKFRGDRKQLCLAQ